MTGADARVVQLLKEARGALEAERRRRTEPIAIVGIGCRFPGGASSPSQFWKLLTNGIDATSEVPLDRWDASAVFDPDPSVTGKTYTKRGAFIEQISDFEPEFFGISPREALGMDPQQRLLLEVAWESLEDAGIPAEALRGSATGVWVGLSLDDYARRAIPTGQLERIDPYNTLGNARSVAAGRIAYVFGLEGPVLQLDTACSSSLVAVHLACESLRAGETNLGLVGGVSLMSSPEASVALSKLMALSPDGRCKTFDASADGYGRGEGCGVVVLRRLSDARAAGDRIYAVVRGSAVNHDGRSNGLTAPNGLAQEALIRSALARAAVEASEVAYVEAHGTGTLLGDPIEVMALNRVYGAEREPARPLRVGSVKTNLGHLEAAAGIAALIKVALSVCSGHLVPSLHFRHPNPKIPWASLALRVGTEHAPWPAGFSRRLAGVSSFGISGTNAHVLVEQAPEAETPRADVPRSAELVVISAKTEAALLSVAGRLVLHVRAHPELTLGELAYNLGTKRSLLEQRLALSVTTREELCRALDHIERGDFAGAKAFRGPPSDARGKGKTAWVFTGQGAQVLGMGQALSAQWPVFRSALDQACAEIDRYLDRPLRDVMWGPANGTGAGLLDQTAYTQPALFAFQWALAALWRSWGVEPDVLIGHSIGELAAACVAGLFSMEDAARLVCERGRLMQALAPGGAMLAIATTESAVSEGLRALASATSRLSLAAVNSPSSAVVSGDEPSVHLVAERFRALGVATQRLNVSHAFHSALVEPMLADFMRAAESVTFRALSVPLVSNLSGRLAGPEVATAAYWVRHAREAVRFADGVRALESLGARTFLELGPRATLLPMVAESLTEPASALLASGRKGVPEAEAVLTALAAWVGREGRVNWTGIFPGGGRRVSLPNYPFQRRRYWLAAEASTERAGRGSHHPLLGRRLRSAGVDATYEVLLSSGSPAWLSAHRIAGRVVMPGAGLVELLCAAAEHHRDASGYALTQLVLKQPLLVPEHAAQRVQVILSEGGTRARVYSQAVDAAESDWILNATAHLGAAPEPSPQRLDLAELSRRCPEALDPERLYDAFSQLGLEYGAAFRGLRRVARGATEVIADVELAPDLETSGYGVHPALLDAALQAIAALSRDSEPALLLPFEFGRCVLHQPVGAFAHLHARLLEPATSSAMRVDLVLSNRDGDVLVEIGGLYLRRAVFAEPKSSAPTDALQTQYRLRWTETPRNQSRVLQGRWAMLSFDDGATTAQAVRALASLGAHAKPVELADLPQLEADHLVCAWGAAGDAEAALQMAQYALSVVHALARQAAPPRLWWLTHNAVAVSAGDPVALPASTLWGLARTVMQEHPELHCTLLDLAHGDPLEDALAEALADGSAETQIAVRGARRFVARLERAADAVSPRGTAADATTTQPHFEGPGTVLITGGLGALGLEHARWLADRGVRHLLLLSRRGSKTPGAAEAIADLERRGARVTVAAADVESGAALAAVLRSIPAELPLRGVIHAAGLLDDGLLAQQTPERFARVMRPKVMGAFNLHVLTQGRKLDWFVLFSSIAGTFGSAGQGAYAAGNTFLDALAAHRSSLGQVAVSIAWGPWAGRGMAAELDYKLQARLNRQGITPLAASQALAHFEQALTSPDPQRVVAAIDLRKMSAAFGGSPPPVWQALLPKVAPPPTDTSADFSAELIGLSFEQRAFALTALVRGEVARVLSLPNPQAVPLDQPLNELGLDSLMAIELRDALGKRIGTPLPATLVFEQPSAGAIVSYLLTGPLAEVASAAPPPEPSSQRQTLRRKPAFIDDAVLDPDFRPQSSSPPIEAAAVLLTGATGFLGAFLLSELLQQTRAHVSCIVRAADPEAATSRIVENMRRYGLWDDAHASRVSALPGDLSKPNLGLGEVELARLAERVDAVYNNGAQLSFAAAYGDLKASHVNGTREILRLAATGRPKAIHHVSSTVVFDSSAYRDRPVPESTRPSEIEGLYLGYSQCKWVTENLVWEAAALGQAITVHRPAFIGGSSLNGVWNTADFVCRLLKSIVETGYMPGDLDLDLNLSPVDYVARSIIELSRRESSRGRAFHLHHPRSLRLEALGEVLRGLGYPVTGISYWDWIERLKTQPEGPLYPLVPILSLRWPPTQLTYFELSQRGFQPRLECAKTEAALGAAGITCPPLDGTLFDRYLRYLLATGYIKPKA
jgi:thioester reductase-like protein